MKALKGSFAVIWLLGLVIVAVGTFVQHKPKPVKAPQVVYVDRERLITLHPAWKQVLSIRSAISEISGAGTDTYSTTFNNPIRQSKEEVFKDPSIQSRGLLTSKLERDALSALSQIENYEREKNKRETDAKRQELETNMRAAVAEKTREVEQQLEAARRQTGQNRQEGRLNILLKIAALKSRVGSRNLAEDLKVRNDLATAEKSLEDYDLKTAELLEEQSRVPKEELDHFKTRSRLRVEAELTAIRSDRESQMLEAVTTQRDETLAELHKDALSSFLVKSKPLHVNKDSSRTAGPDGGASRIVTAISESGRKEALRKLQDSERMLMERIVRDITTRVRLAARENKLVVKFDRSANVPDYTVTMAGYISLGDARGETIAGAGGSG